MPKGLRRCFTCPNSVGALQQRTRHAAGFTIVVCPDCDRLDAAQLGARLQQILALGTTPGEGPQEVG